MIKYLIILLIAILVVGTPVQAVDLTNLSATSGETWIRWSWNLEPLTPADSFLRVEVDGAQKLSLDLPLTPEEIVPLEYYLTDLEPNEKHSIKVYVVDNSTYPPTVSTLVSTATKTTQPSSYNNMIFIIALLLLGASLLLSGSKSVILALILAATSGVLNIYISTAVYQVNSSFSIVCTIAAIISGAIIVYLLYGAWEDKKIWRD